MAIQSYKLGPGTLKLNIVGIVPVSTTSGSKVITATTPTFLTGDVGAAITGTGIAAGSTIASVESPTQATLSANATATGSAISATITPVGSVQDVSCQFDEFAIKPEEKVDTGDDFDALCGETLLGDDDVTYEYAAEGNFLQDISASGLVAYSYTNKGKQVRSEFVPNTVLARKVTFPLRVAPLDLGGKTKTRPTSALKWAVPRGFDPVLS